MNIKDIKFKAKRLDNNTWVEGYFYSEFGNTYIIDDRQSESMLNINEAHQVDPLTVCQFTGLKDCKGNEIWEHDLIHFAGYNNTAEVIWSVSNCAFMAVHENKHSYLLHYVIKICKIEKIGNKFDKEK